MKQLEQCLNLFWSQQTPMIVAPDILSKIEGQPFSADSPFGCQTPLEITPEALQAVDVAPLPIAERLAVVHKPVDVAPRCDARVAGKGVRADDGATLHALVQERQQRLGFHVRYHLRPHQATSTQDPKDSLLSGSTAPLRALNTLCQAPVAPGTSQVGLVDLHHAGEDMGNVPDHGLAHHDQGSQDSLSLQAGLLGNHLGTLPQDEPAQQSPPLPWRQPKRQRPGHPLVVAGCTTTLTSPNAPALGVLTSRAPNHPSHATILSQVAVLGLYPKRNIPALPKELTPYPIVANIDYSQGPVFDNNGYLYFANYVEDGTVGRMSPDGKVEVWAHTGGKSNGLKIDGHGNVVVADVGGHDGADRNSRVTRIHPVTRQLEVLTDNYEGKPYGGIYEVCLDSKGDIYFADPRGSSEEEPIGAVCLIKMDADNNPAKVIRVADGLAYPNGMALYPGDESRFFVGEMRTRKVEGYFRLGEEAARLKYELNRTVEATSGETSPEVISMETRLEEMTDERDKLRSDVWVDGRLVEYDRSADGTLSNKRTAFEFSDYSISGFRFDEYNRLWVARYPGGTVDVIDVDRGEALASYEAGGDKVSNVCWWEKSLYVCVSGRHSIHRLDVGVRGAPIIT